MKKPNSFQLILPFEKYKTQKKANQTIAWISVNVVLLDLYLKVYSFTIFLGI